MNHLWSTIKKELLIAYANKKKVISTDHLWSIINKELLITLQMQ